MARIQETMLAGPAPALAVRIPSSQLATVMRRAGGPTAPADIGADPAFYNGAVRHARYLRDRFTFLDLAGDAGLLDGQLFS